MKRITKSIVLAALLVLWVTGIIAAQGVTLSVVNEVDFDQPSLALLKYASFFVTDLGDFGEDPVMVITLDNGYQEPVTGYFSARLFTGDGSKIGDGAIKEIMVLPGETSWEVRAGGLTNVELLTDVLEHAESKDGLPSTDFLKDTFDLGSIEEWEVDRAWGDKTWFKNNIFDYSQYSDFTADDIPEMIDTALSLQVPRGTYKLEITFNYKDPAGAQQSPRTQNIIWQITNPDPVALISPVDDAEGLSVEPVFTWQLPDLPAGFETTSAVIITDTVTGAKETLEIGHDSGYNSEFSFPISRSDYDFLRGRWYEWTVSLTGSRGQVVGGEVPSPERFALNNTMPEVTSLTASGGTADLWEGENLTFTAVFADEGTPEEDLEVLWLLDDSEVNPDSVSQYTYRAMTAGTHTVEVQVTDSFGESDLASLTFTVNENLPPEVTITNPDGSPVDKTDYTVGETLSLGSEIVDPEDEGFARIEWSVDGTRIASGETFDLRLGKSGSKEITLVAEDIQGNIGEDSLTIDVADNTPPVVTITSPEERDYLFGETLELAATATDDLIEDPEITWEVLGGETISDTYTVPATEGEITLRAWTRDEQGQLGEAMVTINAVPNTAPEVRITSPEPGITFTMEGNDNPPVTIEALAEASDPDEGQTIDWSWEVIDNTNNQTVDSGETGEAASYQFELARVGIYTLIARATDSYGDTGESSVAFNIEKPVPEQAQQEPKEELQVEITAPAAGSTFYAGEEITLQGRVLQNKFVNNTVFTWMSGDDPDNLATIGTGAQLNYLLSEPGEKTLKLIGMNKNALNGEAVINITVLPNTLPEVSIEDLPEGGIVVGTEVFLRAVTYDDDGHQVTAAWKVNGLEPPTGAAAGDQLNLSYLAVGENTITATARDELGARSSVEVVIPVRANQAPVINITGYPEEVVIGTRVNLAYQVTEPDQDSFTVDWTVLDPVGSPVDTAGDDSGLSFTADSAGNYVVTLRAEDSRGAVTSIREIVRAVPNKPPVVAITAPEPGSPVTTGEAFDLQLSIVDPEGDEIDSIAINGTAVSGFSLDSSGNTVIPFTVNQSGTVELNVLATDEQGKAGSAAIGLIAREPAVEVVENQSPEVEIVIPGLSAEGIAFGETLNLTARVTDPDNTPEEVVVNWLVNGELAGTGLSLNYQFEAAGQVRVEAQAVDVSGAAGSAEATVLVRENQAPTGQIIEPAAGVEYEYEETGVLQAEAVDPEGGEVSYVWLLDDETIGSGQQLDYTFTAPGSHLLTLRVTDPYGAGSEYTLSLRVEPPEGEILPPEITAPMDRLVLTSTQAVILEAENIPGEAQYLWRSSLDGVLADSEAVSLSPGEHLIMLLVNGLQADSVTVFVVAEEAESVAAPTGLLNGDITLRLGDREITLDPANCLEYEIFVGNVLVVGQDSSIELYIYDSDTMEELTTGTYRFTESGYTAETD